jgi:DNA-binding response OmpR family regulator
MSRDPRAALIVEDERPIRELLRLHLGSGGFDTEGVADGKTALRMARSRVFDLMVLDVMLPGLDGVSLCQAIRAHGPNTATPILMVTARDAESDKVRGLEAGADDYVTKPFGVRELMARVHAVLRRFRQTGHGEARPLLSRAQGQVDLHLDRRIARVRGQPVDLTRQEFDLFTRLATRPGVVFSRQALMQSVWSHDRYVTERTVDAVISRLRKKVERDPHDPELLLTVWGVGYKFADEV